MIVCPLCCRCYDDSVASCTDAGHPQLSEMNSGSCEMIAGYRLDFLLRSRTSGNTYLARQIASGRSCRITILAADEKQSQQFLNEAQVAAGLFHPNVVDVYEAGSLESGEVFVVAEDPEGESLRDLLNRVEVPHLLTSIQVIRQTAEALHTIHLKGLMHRAVAPENIILTTDAEHRLLVRIKDLDFGSVVERSIVSNKFLIDSAIDSIKYYAPEQFSGEAATMKTDVYGLGVVLYEMLAGSPPFTATKAAALIEKHKNEKPPEIKIDNFDLRMLLSHTLMESLHKRPERRQPSANALARQMRHIEQLATHVSTPPPAGAVPPPPTRETVVAVAAIVASPPLSRSVPVVGKPEVSYYEVTTPQIFRESENEPVALFDDDSGRSIPDNCDECETTPADDPGGLAYDLIAFPDQESNEPEIEDHIIERVAPTPARASRLRVRRRKLHSKASQPALEITENGSLQIVETTPSTPGKEHQILRSAMTHLDAEPENPVIVPLLPEPTRIEWQQRVDEIPWAEDVVNVLVKDRTPEDLPIDEQQERSMPEPPAKKPAKFVWDLPEDDIPIEEDVLEVLSKERPTEIPFAPAAVFQPEPIPAAHTEPDEITAVSAPIKRIEIDLESQSDPRSRRVRSKRSSMQVQSAAGFFPTILGAAEIENTFDPAQRDSLFSAYDGSSEPRFPVRARSLLVGGGIAALIILFLHGQNFVDSRSAEEDAGGSVKAAGPESLPQAVQRVNAAPAEQKALKNFRQPVTEDHAVEGRSNLSPAKSRLPRPAHKNDEVRSPVSKTKAGRSDSAKSPDSGKIKQSSEPEKKAPDRISGSAPDKIGTATRPRIVKVPSP